MAKIGKMVSCVIGSMTDDGKIDNADILYRDFEDGLRGGEFAELERLQTIYLWCCLCVANMQTENPKRPHFITQVNEQLWYVVQGECSFNDRRDTWPIVDAIKTEFNKLSPRQKFMFLD